MTEGHEICKIYLVRHAESIWGAECRIQGQKDPPLSPKGVKQAQRLAHQLKDIPFDAIFSSDLRRAVETAQIVRRNRPITIKTSELARERNFGVYEEEKIDDFLTHTRRDFRDFDALPADKRWDFRIAPSAESDAEVAKRFNTFVIESIKEHPNGTILLVSHSGPLVLFLAYNNLVTYGEFPPGSLGNTGYIKLRFEKGVFIIEEIKGKTQEASHLE